MNEEQSYQPLLTAPELAKRLQVNTSWVYSHAGDLGALRLGKYLRFSWNRVLDSLQGGLDPSVDGETVGVAAQRPAPRSIDPES